MDRTINIIKRKSTDHIVVRFSLAALFAILLHLMFCIFVSYPDNLVKVNKISRHVTLLPYDTTIPSEQKMLEWMKIMDPMAVIKPDRVSGFSMRVKKTLSEDKPFFLEKHLSGIADSTFLPLKVKVESEEERVTRYWDFRSATVSFENDIRGVKAKKYPIVIVDDGTLLPLLFNNREELNKILLQNKKPLKETVLKLECYNNEIFFPRVTIDASSGNMALDNLAVKMISIKSEDLFENKKDNKNKIFISLKWNNL